MVDQLHSVKRARSFNDALRHEMPHGSVRISHEVGQRFSNVELRIITQLIQDYAFGPSEDPDELHDTGIIEFEGVKMIWRIEIPATDPTVGAPARPTIRITFDYEARC